MFDNFTVIQQNGLLEGKRLTLTDQGYGDTREANFDYYYDGVYFGISASIYQNGKVDLDNGRLRKEDFENWEF